MRYSCWLLLLAIWLLPTQSVAQASVAIEVNDTASELDDYFCWSPVRARIRLNEPETAARTVVLQASRPGGTGDLVFARDPGTAIRATDFAPEAELALTLPADGAWVSFVVSGSAASTDGKDVAIAALDADTDALLGELPVMVRVRKDATALDRVERDRFLAALAALHGHQRPIGPGNAFEKYARAHGAAFSAGIHRADLRLPLFLAWHRGFLLSLERELQAIDPRVALPYWRFDADVPNVFEPDFLGSVPGPGQPQGNLVVFSPTNPLLGWRMTSGGPLARDRNPVTRLQAVADSFNFATLATILQSPAAAVYEGPVARNGINSELERRHHNFAHNAAGGWMASGTSPRDPLFFLLHANVDRVWAEWQALLDRFDASAVDAYPAQGAYPGPAGTVSLRKGSYAEDAMWPWSRDDGSATPQDPNDDWPDDGFDLLPSPAGFGPDGAPTPASMIDYMNVTGTGKAHGACYDDLPFFQGSP